MLGRIMRMTGEGDMRRVAVDLRYCGIGAFLRGRTNWYELVFRGVE